MTKAERNSNEQTFNATRSGAAHLLNGQTVVRIKSKNTRKATFLLALFTLAGLAESRIVYQNDFQSAEVGKVPAEFLVLDGGFMVKEAEGNKFLELPGSPLENFAVQFGPAQVLEIAVSARINGKAQGRR